MIVLCASCGWMDRAGQETASFRGASHLRSCPTRDDLRFVPWWTIIDEVFEVGWHPLNVNERERIVDPFGPLKPTSDPNRYEMATRATAPLLRYRFTEYADRVLIGVGT